MTRICITGGPKTGKTTLANKLCITAGRSGGSALRHTDDLIPLGWSEGSEAASKWFDEPGPWIIEGVAVSRALRKWRDAHPGERPPVDQVIYLHGPYVELTRGQDAMSKGVALVHAEIEPWLRQHGVLTAHQYRINLGDHHAQ